MKVNNSFDVIIIGAGAAGLNIASFAAKVGLRTILFEKNEANIGGDCLNHGCVPSKALIHKAKSARWSGEQSFLDALSYVKEMQDELRKRENKEYLEKEKGYTIVIGTASFHDPHTILVNEEKYLGNVIVIATGSYPRTLSVSHDDSLPFYNNENIFSLTKMPKHLVFVGAGPISCELAQAVSMFGIKVTMISDGPRLLGKEVKEAQETLQKSFEAQGIEILFESKVREIKEGKVIIKRDDGTVEERETDGVFVGIGREISFTDLQVENAGIEKDGKGKVMVDEHLRTSQKHIYLGGDAAGQMQFTHATEEHAKVILNNMFSPFKKRINYDNFAWVTYTTPEIATFGLSYDDALEYGYSVLRKWGIDDDRAIIDGEKDSFVQVYADTAGYIYGGTVVHTDAGTLSQELILAITHRLPLTSLFNTVYPYLSKQRLIKALASEWESRKITKGRLSLLRKLFRLLN